MRIILDAMGGDDAPKVTVEGALNALENDKRLCMILVGCEDQINAILSGRSYDSSRLEIKNTTEVITNDEHPVTAIRRKKDSSIVVGMRMLRDGEADAFVSAGSTGAVLAAATLILKTIPGINRPALAPIMPTAAGRVMVIDCGANVDAKPQNLVQFALMGSVYMKSVEKYDDPRIGLVNIGTEEEKGNELAKATHPMLKELPINFIGNIEAREIPMGGADVVVCDAFVGNVIIKMMEGAASSLIKMLKEELTATLWRKLMALGLKKAFRSFKNKMDYAEYGGAPLLGVNGCVVKGHGSSNARAIESAIYQAARFVDGALVDTIKSQVESLSETLGE